MTVKKKKRGGEKPAWPFGVLVPLHKLIKCIINFFNPKSFASSGKTEENILGSASFWGLKHPQPHTDDLTVYQQVPTRGKGNTGSRQHFWRFRKESTPKCQTVRKATGLDIRKGIWKSLISNISWVLAAAPQRIPHLFTGRERKRPPDWTPSFDLDVQPLGHVVKTNSPAPMASHLRLLCHWSFPSSKLHRQGWMGNTYIQPMWYLLL